MKRLHIILILLILLMTHATESFEKVKGAYKTCTKYEIKTFAENLDTNIIKIIDEAYDPNNRKKMIAVFHYNNDGNVKESRFFRNDGNLVIDKYKYDNNGNNIEWVSSDTMGKSSQKATYNYDSLGNMIEAKFYSENNVLYIIHKAKYNDAGYEIEESEYNPVWKKFHYKTTFKHDSLGRTIESTAKFYRTESLIKNEYIYDNNGNNIESLRYENNNLSGRHTYKYDESGNKTEDCRYHSDGSLKFKDTFTYDTFGNIIEEVRYLSDSTYLVKRTYIYEYK